jgi:PAS domain S-box-containing protein
MVVLELMGRLGKSERWFFRLMLLLAMAFPFAQHIVLYAEPHIHPIYWANYLIVGLSGVFWASSFVFAWAKERIGLLNRICSYVYVCTMIYWMHLNNFDHVLSSLYVLGISIGSILHTNIRQIVTYAAVVAIVFASSIYWADSTPMKKWYLVGTHWAGYLLTTFFIANNFRNVNALKKSQRLAEERSVELERLLDSFSAMVCYKDRFNRITRVNQAFADYMGKTKEELEGMNLNDIIPADLAENFYLEDKMIFDRGLPVLNIVEKIMLPNGNHRWVRSDKRPLLDSKGQVQGLVIYSVDITPQMDAEQQQKEYALQLERNNRDLEEFAYAASHDLREPLRTITSYVQLLRRRQQHKLDEEGLEFMQFIEKASHRMNTLILGLLNYSRAGRVESHKIQLDSNALLEELLGILQFQINEAGAEVEITSLPKLYMVEEHLRALFQNLISNALKYRGGRPLKIRVWCEEEEGSVRLVVADNGIGIAPEYAERIFGLFRRLHRQDEIEGAGLGLSICKKIVQVYGGQIGVDSRPGEGSAFWFTFPKNNVLPPKD